MIKWIVVIFLYSISSSWASNYYVNKNATGGTYNGQTWGTAWRSFSAINWGLIQPGDKVYISGGTDSTIYYEQLTVGKNGTAANPITIIAGKYAPVITGHSGRVIIDGEGTREQSIYVHDRKYVTIKGFELRHASKGVYVEGDIWVSNVVLDSLNIYDYQDQAGIMLNGYQTTFTVDSVTIKNCRIVSFQMYPGETDGIYCQGAQHTVIHNNYIRVPNQDPYAHNDVIQGYHCNGFIIYNNILINDSVYSPEGGGIPLILGSEHNNPVVIYNNFIYMGGVWLPAGNMGGGLCLRWYDGSPMPPTYVINNTIVINGPRVRGFWWQYGANVAVNNIIAMYCPPAYRNLTWMANFDVGDFNSVSGQPANVNDIRHNLFWKMDLDVRFDGTYTGNGHTGDVSGWTSWVSTFGGTGVHADPMFIQHIGYEPDQGALNGELQPSSPAINQGENLQALIESFGLPWEDIYGNLRDNTPTIGAYEYTGGSDSTFSLSLNIANSWNMVSVPGINPDGMGVDTWWAYRDMNTNVFKHSNGYLSVTTTTPGIGYWMRHSGSRIYNTGDEWPATGIQKVAHAPLNGTAGWNLIGGYELSVAATGVTTNPPGLQSGPIYKFSTGYLPAATINPGYGYWINLSAAGQIIIPETLAKGEEPKEWFPENWGKMILTDATETTYTLYAVKGEVDLSQYELPPSPLEGMFDIRFSTGRIAEDLNSAIKSIEMSGVTYPLTVRVVGMGIRLMDETGKTINVNLKSGEDIVISDEAIQKLMVSCELVPAEYALAQNYPNPFNPSTVIEFSLPEATDVSLTIYNILGQKVTELVNGNLEAGHYNYQWNAKAVATGMYIYELRTENYISVKKMLLMK